MTPSMQWSRARQEIKQAERQAERYRHGLLVAQGHLARLLPSDRSAPGVRLAMKVLAAALIEPAGEGAA